MRPIYLPLILLVFTGFACQTHVSNLRVDPSFTSQALLSSPLIVGGVDSSVDQFTKRDSRYFASELKAALEKNVAGISVVSRDSLKNKMGGAAYNKMMEEWLYKSKISGNSLRRVRGCKFGASYMVFARPDIFRKSTKRNEIPVKNSKKYGRKYNMETQREVDTQYNIFDLKTGQLVWDGSIHTKISEYKMYNIPPGNTSIRMYYPDPPSRIKVLQKSYQGFAENLPKSK